MNIEIIKSEKGFLELKFDADAHTILNLLKRRLLDNKSVIFVGYNKPHPLIDTSTLVIKTKGTDPKKILKNEISVLEKELKKLVIK